MWLTLFLLTSLLWCLVLCFIMCSALLGFMQTQVPFVRSSGSDLLPILKRYGFSSGDHFLDLGSGDGSVVLAVSRATGARGTGIELTRWTHVLAKLRGRQLQGQVQFLRENFLGVDLAFATTVYTYLYPPVMKQVEAKLLASCKPGTLVICKDFPLPTLEPLERISMTLPHELFVYRFK